MNPEDKNCSDDHFVFALFEKFTRQTTSNRVGKY